MTHRYRLENERGVALVVSLLVTLAVAALAVGAIMMSSNMAIIGRYDERLSILESVAETGLEEARSAINGNKTLYPDSLYNVLENRALVIDAFRDTIPNVWRTLYVGPTGITTGQYGINGSVVAVAEDRFGNRVVRREAVSQESFAKYAYFTTIEGSIWFASGDQIWGPVHSNDRIRIHSSGAWFHSDVTTGRDVYQAYNGQFDRGYTENAPIIPMPTTADLLKLKVQGTAGKMAFVGNTSGGHGEATTRIEFIAIDLNSDGDVTDENEGFLRVYQHLGNANWVTGDVPGNYSSRGLENSLNCGDWAGGTFLTADDHTGSGAHNHSWLTSVTSSTRRCYLGGSDSIWGMFDAADPEGGRWLQWPGPVNPLVAGRPDAAYLFPITRPLNPDFKGVIFVEGKVAVSGVVRGRVTVAATDDIILADDIRYSMDPGAGTCTDIMGFFSGDDVVIADNTLNTPTRAKRPGQSNNPYRTYDETMSEFIHGVVLAIDVNSPSTYAEGFTVENYNSGPSSAEFCEGTSVGRGCIYLTGGIIQRKRGAVGLTSGRGYIKRYSYDQCAVSDPPPYFPTTGHFALNRVYEIDPVGFDVDSFFRLLTP